jgi:CBS domain-containing protein
VHCPLRDTSLALDDCIQCGNCSGLRIDPDTEGTWLVCEAAPRSTGEPRQDDLRGSAERVRLSEIMTPNVICVDPGLDLDALAALFLERGISGAPVVNDDGWPIGIVSKTDLLRQRYSEPGDDSPRQKVEGDELDTGPDVGVEPKRRAVVADVMMPVTFALPQNETVARAAALMAFEGVHRVAVLGANGKVTGILSSLDVLRWLAQHAGFVIGS